jgi:protein-S-isoprenylcysteine O-methyltransferase Ste14
MSLLDISLRIYLFVGLAAHKVVWEVMKRRRGQPSTEQQVNRPVYVRFLKAGKIAITLALFAQILVPEVLPIMGDPIVLRIVGTILFTLGLLTAIVARIQLGLNWSDIEVGQIKQDHALVNSGLYRYVRHPIYTGDLGMLLGVELCLNSWLVVAVAGIAMPTIYQTLSEERRLVKTVAGYDAYCEQTKRFIPFIL